MIIRDHMRFGWVTEPTEHERPTVQPNRFGFSGDDPEPAWQLEPEKRMEIRVVDGRVEVVECE